MATCCAPPTLHSGFEKHLEVMGLCKKSQMPLAIDDPVSESRWGLVHLESRKLVRSTYISTADAFQMRVAFQVGAVAGC